MINWDKIKYFKRTENWGDTNKIDPFLVYSLDALREMVGKPIIIHCAYAETGHSNNSKHYQGKAADIHIVGLNILDQYLAAEKVGLFNGIGIYPYWNNPGLHLDVRTNPARWALDIAGNYINLNANFIKGIKL